MADPNHVEATTSYLIVRNQITYRIYRLCLYIIQIDNDKSKNLILLVTVCYEKRRIILIPYLRQKGKRGVTADFGASFAYLCTRLADFDVENSLNGKVGGQHVIS